MPRTHRKTRVPGEALPSSPSYRFASQSNRSLRLRSTGGEVPCKATFSEEIALVQNAYCGFLPALRHNGEFYLSFLYIKNSIGRVALNKDRLLFGKRCDLPTAVDGRKEGLGIEFAEFLGRYDGCHEAPLS